MSDERIKARFKQFLELDIEYPKGSDTCAYCARSLLPDAPVLEMEYRTKNTRYVYRFCQQKHVAEGWPLDDYPTDDSERVGK